MHHSHPQAGLDKRVLQTRMALFQAFAALVMEHDYNDIRIADIIRKAGISRSTFYQHYRNKDDILADSMSAMFAALADAATGQGDADGLLMILEHWWEHRALGRIILNGPPYRRLARELTDLIQQRLSPSASDPEARSRFDPHAVRLAEGQLAILRAWLSGEVVCRPHALAAVMLDS